MATPRGWAAAKQHVMVFGQVFHVKLFSSSDESKDSDMQIRTLYVDGRIKEFTTGEPHDVTDKTFVVRRVYRINDALPEESKTPPKWKWQRGGWLLVDRITGRVSNAVLPDFDPFYSAASWYEDYAAYCGISGNAENAFAVVVQLGNRKPLIRKPIGAAKGGNEPESECPPPVWDRNPARVTFTLAHDDKLSFDIHGRAAEMQTDDAGKQPRDRKP